MAVGIIMLLEAVSMCRPSNSTYGAVPLSVYFTPADAPLHFPYPGFDWLPFLPPQGMQWLATLLGVAALTMALGLYYRLSATLVFLVWAYFYAIEMTRTYWMSYYYLELLVTFLLIWMPAARRYSLDSWLARHRSPTASATVPCWCLVVLRGQLLITYFYAGVAKLSHDWLADAQPVRHYLAKAHVQTRCESWLPIAWHGTARDVLQSDGLAYFLSWGGAVFDLAIGPLLLVKRTRFLGFTCLLFFHGFNHTILFDDIVWFPLLGITSASIFFAPEWPERALRALRRAVAGDDPNSYPAFPAEPIRSEPGGMLGRCGRLSATGRGAAVFVGTWLVAQALLPIRHYFIPGDARFTFEGLSFSWRLKAEVYSASPFHLRINDPAVVEHPAEGGVRVHWQTWHGPPIVFRQMNPNQIDWSHLPEVLVVREPILGERILYNPLGAPDPPRTVAQARAHIEEVWLSLHGRRPAAIHPVSTLKEIVDAYNRALQGRGHIPFSDHDAAVSSLLRMVQNQGGNWLSLLRRLPPFVLDTAPAAQGPFLVIEDPALMSPAGSTTHPSLNPNAWRNLPATETPDAMLRPTDQPAHLVVHMASSSEDIATLLPSLCLFVPAGAPPSDVHIRWNYPEPLSASKRMHLSVQPFLLRRYARHVADWWETEYARRPAVHATTSVSLNFRPPQAVVDPNTDLAAVEVSWFRHNPWIRDLESPRVPLRPQGSNNGTP